MSSPLADVHVAETKAQDLVATAREEAAAMVREAEAAHVRALSDERARLAEEHATALRAYETEVEAEIETRTTDTASQIEAMRTQAHDRHRTAVEQIIEYFG